MSELVTGEAVVLGLRPARLPSRAVAVFIDLVVAWAAYIAVSMALIAATASLGTAVADAVSVATFVLVLVGMPIAVETLSHGRSLGKAACGLRVVRDEDGGPIRFRHALVRGAMGAVEILMTLGVVACIASLVSGRGRRLGDLFGGTLVVRERIPAPRPGTLPAPPPWLADRFAGVDLSQVPEGLWLAVRQYLTRMEQLDPQAGSSLAERLARDVSVRTGAPVPEGLAPAVYLAGVLAERQGREARRTFHRSGGLPGAGAPQEVHDAAGPRSGPSTDSGGPVPGRSPAGPAEGRTGRASAPAAGTVPPSGPEDGGAAVPEAEAPGESPHASPGTGAARTGFVPPG